MRLTLATFTFASLAAFALAAPACGGGGTTATGGGTSSSNGGAGGATSSSSSSTGSTSTSSSASSSGVGGAIGAPFTSKGSSSYEAQTSLAADTKGNAVAVWIAFFADNTSAIGYSVSHDGGALWTDPKVVYAPGGRLASNPVVGVDGQGRFTLAWLGFRVDAVNPDEHVYVARLDKSDTFGAPVVASDDGSATTRDFDKPSLTVDGNDNLLVTWADFTGSGMGTPPSLTFARSVDGTTFTRTTVTADATFGNLAYVCVDPAGGPAAPLYLVHLGAGGTVTLRKSADQGASWQTKSVPATSVVFQDITCVAHGADLWIAYASGAAQFSPSMDSPGDAVSLVHSASGGDAFDAPVTISNGAAGTQYLFPRLARSPAGELVTVYYQGTTGGPVKLERATSTNGMTWSVSEIESAGNFTLDRTLASWLGGYLGLAPTAAGTLATFTDNAEGKAHVRLHQTP